MFKYSVLTVIMLLSVCANAQEFSISGTVYDGKSKQPLQGASVQVAESNHVAVTDPSGKFKIENVTMGSYTLLVKFLGYQDRTELVKVNANLELILNLDEAFQLTDEVVVYATRANEKTPTTFTNINKEVIQKQNFGQDLPMLLNWSPSVVTTSDAGAGVGYTGIRIRGSDATRVNVTINGIPYNDGESQGTFWVNISDIASSAQSIQIQRGVGTSTNGAGAFGATINLQTNTRIDQPYAENVLSGGSFRTFRNTLSFGTGLLNNKWVFDGRISRIKSAGFIDRASSDLQSYYFSAGYYSNKTMIKAITFGGKERTYQAWYGVPQSRLNNDEEAMYETAGNEGWNEQQIDNMLNADSRTFNPYTYKNQVDNYKQDHYQLHFSQRLSDPLTANVAVHFTPGRGYYEEFRYDNDLEDYGLTPITIGDSLIESVDLIRRRWLDNDFYGFTYSLNYEQERLNVILGGGWNRYDCDHFGEIIWAEVATVPVEYRYYFNNGDKTDFNSYAKLTYDFQERLTAFIDLQYRRVDYETIGIENKQNTLAIRDHFNFFNPKIGATFFISDHHRIYASYSRGNREPVRDDFVDAPQGKTPKHESLNDYEAGYKAVSERFTINANVYYMDYKNQLVLTGQVNDVGASIRTNVEKSYRAGIELDFGVKISEHFFGNANVTVSQNKISQFTEVIYDYGDTFEDYIEVKNEFRDTDISFSPNVIAGGGLTYKPFKNLEAAWLAKYVGKQFMDNTSNDMRSLDAYFVNDARITYTAKLPFLREIGISLLVNNILDERYEANGYTWGYLAGSYTARENYYFPQAGRNFLAMLTMKF